MPRYRNQLPQLSESLFLTDGGLETTIIFRDGIDLPEFAAFSLLETEKGYDILKNYYRKYANIASNYQAGLILESMTWRASEDWGKKLGYSNKQLVYFNRMGIELLKNIRHEYENVIPHIVISGCIGPRSDGYKADVTMTAEEAAHYHRTQIGTIKKTEADMVAALTIPYIAEGAGIALAARSEEMPVVISFTVETDGRLPSGETLKEAIIQIDALTNYGPAYYMINCAHPNHFANALGAEPWTNRIRAIRANASTKSHAELDEATELDEGNPIQLGLQYLYLSEHLKNLNILGGCCGTDHRHVEEICKRFVNHSAELESTLQSRQT